MKKNPSTVRRIPNGLVLTLAGFLGLAGATAIAQPGGNERVPPARVGASAQPEAAAPVTTQLGTTKAAEKLREGTRLTDEVGTFQNLGDRIAFVPGGNKESFRVLENLALQRIGQTLNGGRGQQVWIVSGVITEYGQANYLLVTKASIPSQESGSTANP